MIRLLPLILLPATVAAQMPAEVTMERAGYVAWLKDAPNSPLAAVAQQPIGDGVSLGPTDADIPLEGVEEHRVSPSESAIVLRGPSGERALPRGRPVRLGQYTLYVSGAPPRTIVTVFGSAGRKPPPGYYDYDTRAVFTGPLVRSNSREKLRVLSSDGIETEATELGSFDVPLGGGTRLRVLRMPVGGGEESELEIFFQDQTNGAGTYPAGRFVSLVPLPNGEFRLDFNRARNPFCAYSSVYACPAPWRGNRIPVAIEAGERYAGGGLDSLTPEKQQR